MNNILDLIYPPRCITCEEIVPPFQNIIMCNICQDTELFEPVHKLEQRDNSFCHCGLPTTLCDKPNAHEFIFAKNTATFLYTGVAKDTIYKFKYTKKPHMAKGLAKLMATHIPVGYKNELAQKVDFVAPIPIHPNRLHSRGFNQAELLAKHFAKELGLPMPKKVILRIKDTKPLSNFSPQGRQSTLQGAFSINSTYNIANKTILLIDDIFTTGTTLNACAKSLYQAGAKHVETVTFSIVPSKKVAQG